MKTLKIHSYYKTPEDYFESKRCRFYFSGVYLHGKVDEMCNNDICYPANYEDFPEGIREVTINYDSGPKTEKFLFLDGVFPCIVDDKYECTAFLWFDDIYENEAYWMRGLIVLNSDEESMADAKKKYEERSICL